MLDVQTQQKVVSYHVTHYLLPNNYNLEILRGNHVKVLSNTKKNKNRSKVPNH